jgi:hypothetical protein
MAAALYMRKDGQKDGRIGMTKLIGAFRDYVNAPKTFVFLPFNVTHNLIFHEAGQHV